VPTYSYNASNELTAASNRSYSYDANGNTLSDAQGRSFTWDFENRLTQAVNPGVGTTNFRYDPFGRRIQKSGPNGTTNYLYAGANIVEEVDAVGAALSRYTYGPNIDEPLAELRSGTMSYYQVDGLGSITSLTSSSATVATNYAYDAFGNLSASTGSTVNPFRYTGRESDSETALYYYRARYYDASDGRLLSEDPDDFASDVNFYRYVYNRPADLIDPSGRRGKKPHGPGPKSNSDAAFYICCQGGAFGVCDGPMARPSSFDNPLFNNWKLKCQKEHEQQHQEDFSSGMFLYAITPSSCVGQPNNTPVGVYDAYQARVECRGYQRQLECLMKMQSLMTSEVHKVNDQLKHFKCDCGK
jgi:RHS repeat-associated protein